MRLWNIAAGVAVALLWTVDSAGAQTKVWVGGASGNWNTDVNWDPSGVPGAGDDVLIASNTSVVVLLDADAAVLSLTLTNSHASQLTTLRFNAWDRTLAATDIYLRKGGNVSHSLNTATATNASGEWVPDGGVFIVCTNITVDSGGSVNVDTNGFTGGPGYNHGRGPGRGLRYTHGGGAGHGGTGGSRAAGVGVAYGNEAVPEWPGSGGAGADQAARIGGNGGGYISILAASRVTVNGTISANGANGASCSGGGSGGGIYITCDTLAGSGTIRANGGNSLDVNGGAGGGGRIAVYLNQADSASISFAASHGTTGTTATQGTLYLDQYDDVMPETLAGSMSCYPEGSSWSPGSLVIAGYRLALSPGFDLNVSGGISIHDSGAMLQLMSNAQVRAASITVSNSAEFVIGQYAVATNIGNFLITHSSECTMLCENTTADAIGIPSGIHAASLILGNGCNIDANGYGWSGGGGYQNGYGPGNGKYGGLRGGGGGYGGDGGKGASSTAYGGTAYDAEYTNAPYRPGSGGAGGDTSTRIGGAGGGYIMLDITGSLEVGGTISANGNNAGGLGGGGGSGGGIYIRCGTLIGGGLIEADGGMDTVNPSYGGGGGGGMIAIDTGSTNGFGGSVTADAGGRNGTNVGTGSPGVVTWIIRPPAGSVFIFR